MAGQAHVNSIAALEDFRSKLLVYLSKAGRVLDDAGQDLVGTRIWLQTDRQLYWKRELKRREHQLAQAEQELMSARLSGHQSAILDRRRVVDRSRATLREAEERIQAVKTWIGQYDSRVESQMKAVQQLRHIMGDDMRKAVAYLETAINTLSEYANLSPTPQASQSQEPRGEAGPEAGDTREGGS